MTLIFLILIPSLPAFPSGEREVSHSFSSLLPTPSSASEEENIDSFDVNPASGRWTVTNTDYTSTIQNGQLNLTGVADGSVDQYQMDRGLRTLDGKIIFRFRVDVDVDSPTAGNFDIFRFTSAGGGSFELHLNEYVAGGFHNSRILFSSEAGTQIIILSGQERIFDNTWYTMRFDFDIPHSDFRIRLTLDNGTKTYDNTSVGLAPTTRANFFGGGAITCSFIIRTRTIVVDPVTHQTFFDYIDAPFKEQEWTNVETPTDADFLTNQPWAARAQDDIDDNSRWQVVVPEFDTFNTKFYLSFDSEISVASTDQIEGFVRIFAVDDDDGGTHEVLEAKVNYEHSLVPSVVLASYGSLGTAGSGSSITNSILLGTGGSQPAMGISIKARDDRSFIDVNVQWQADKDAAIKFESSASIDVSTITADFSGEYIIEVEWHFDFTVNTEANIIVDASDIKERSVFSNIPIIGPIVDGILFVLGAIFAIAMRFFADIQKIVGFLIIAGLAVLQLALEAAINLVEIAIGALEPLLTIISDAVSFLWELFITSAFDILEAIVATLLTLLSELIDFITELIFFVWDALSLPDLLAFIDATLAEIVDFVAWIATTIPQVIQWFLDISIFIFIIWWIGCIPVQFARANFDPLDGIGRVTDFYFNNAVPISILGFEIYVPQGVIFTFWALAILPADFILFTALP